MTLNDYLRHRRAYEAALWAALLLSQAAVLAWIVIADFNRSGIDIEPWRPFVWEFSSVAMWLLLIPVLVAFDRRYPLRVGSLLRHLPRHLLFTIPFSLAHVFGMVALRKAAYATVGDSYDFGPWPRELLYEYVKDIRTYATFLALIYLYRFGLVRLQGEASLLSSPDAGEPVEPIERPERLLIRKLGKEFLISVRDIEWLEASGNYVNLHVAQRTYPLRSTMTALEQRLDPGRFRRVHRSFAVNLDFVAEIEPLDTGDAKIRMASGAVVPCSRRFRANLSV